MRNSIRTNRPSPAGRASALVAQLKLRVRRLDRRRLLAIALAIGAAAITRQAMSRAAAVEAGLGVRQPVVVALQDLAPGTVVEPNDIHLEAWPVDLVPPNALEDPALTIGLTVRSQIAEGEAVVSQRAQPGSLGLGPKELGVTLSQPLARPPLELGQLVQLVGLRSIADQHLAAASLLGTGRIVSFTDDELTVAVSSKQMPLILQHAAVGSVEVVITPLRG